MSRNPDLIPTLKQTFGYTSFRPLQEEIIRDAMNGLDVFALLPTGGGKSLCFQFPALMRPGLTVVVSPLISLMKDQVDALNASGVPATFLNSSLAAGESRERLRGLHTGRYRLLYVAPERLMLSGFLEDLKTWNVTLFAIDEAHCVSEWGHDFRPEYRQLASLRPMFPDVPVMALTATATERVREDIIAQLHLKEPRCYVASFNRPNLMYRVVPKTSAYEQTLAIVRGKAGECGIIYCQSRKATESVAERLKLDGIKAATYHAGLDAEERARNQERFLRDEVKVVCATVAFGMGINKPNVRYVLHYDLPKNIEGYYQETGRAGRDGLPGECVLLFSAGDAVKQTRFIDEKPDPQEQKIARDQLQQMVHYAEAGGCRRASLLGYFGEIWEDVPCGGCDNCLAPRETFDGTLAAQKLLSCVFRIRERGQQGFGLNHLIDILCGADTAMIRKWRHTELSTYGIGREMKKAEWQAVGRELMRLGLLHQTKEKFSVIEVTEEGMATLRERRKITLTRPAAAPERISKTGAIACDETLFEQLRELRRKLADERDVPAYIIFSDVALREMARSYPVNEREFSRISGVGKQKLEEFAATFIREIEEYLKSNPKQIFADSLAPVAPARSRGGLNDTTRESLRRFRDGFSVSNIAQERGFATSTIFGHLATALEAGEEMDIGRLVPPALQKEIEAAIDAVGDKSLSAIKEHLGDRADYGQIRICCTLKRVAG